MLKENVVKWRQVESCHYELILAQGQGPTEEIKKTISECQTEFNSALDDDFNTHLALNAFFRLVKEINRMASAETLTKSIAQVALPTLENFQNILGLVIPKITDDEISSINGLIKKREMLREQKKFEDADKIRDQIADMGIELIDHKSKTAWMKKEKIKSD